MQQWTKLDKNVCHHRAKTLKGIRGHRREIVGEQNKHMGILGDKCYRTRQDVM